MPLPLRLPQELNSLFWPLKKEDSFVDKRSSGHKERYGTADKILAYVGPLDIAEPHY